METLTFKCPNCGGGLIFDPATQKFACEYCISSFTEDEIKRDEKEKEENNAEKDTSQVVLYHCPSCGAEIVTEESTAATFCFYCHNPITLVGRLEGEFKPDKIIPFKIDQKEAESRFQMWLKKKWFLPKDFYSKKQVEKLSGVYFPFWVTDCSIHANMDASAENFRTWRSGDLEHTEIKHYRLEREANIEYNDIETLALKKADSILLEGIEPFDGNDMLPFSAAYLAGFQAEKRDIEQEDITGQIAVEIQGYTKNILSSTITGYSQSSINHLDITTNSAFWEYALMPVWIMTYKGRNEKVYSYAINGQTGKTFGRLPVDFLKLSFLFAGVFTAVFAFLMLIGGLL